MNIRYEWLKHRDFIQLWLARHLPKWLRMWVVVDAFAAATVKNNKTPDNTGYSDVMAVFHVSNN